MATRHQPNEEPQICIAEALGQPADIVRADDWPNWLPLSADRVVPPPPPQLRAAGGRPPREPSFLRLRTWSAFSGMVHPILRLRR